MNRMGKHILVTVLVMLALLALPVMAMAVDVTTLEGLQTALQGNDPIVINASITIPDGTNLNLNGKSITTNHFINFNGTSTISNGTITRNGANVLVLNANSNVTLEKVTLNGTYPIYLYEGADITLKNSETNGWGAIAFAVGGSNTVNIIDSTINSNNDKNGELNNYAPFQFETSNNTLNITGSTINMNATGTSELRAFHFGYDNTGLGSNEKKWVSNNTVNIANSTFKNNKKTSVVEQPDGSSSNTINLNTDGIHFINGDMTDTDGVVINAPGHLTVEPDGKGGFIVKAVSTGSLPQTGDKENLMMWAALMAMSCMGLLAMRRKNEN